MSTALAILLREHKRMREVLTNIHADASDRADTVDRDDGTVGGNDWCDIVHQAFYGLHGRWY